MVAVLFDNGPPQLFTQCDQIMQFCYVGEQSALTQHAELTHYFGIVALLLLFVL